MKNVKRIIHWVVFYVCIARIELSFHLSCACWLISHVRTYAEHMYALLGKETEIDFHKYSNSGLYIYNERRLIKPSKAYIRTLFSGHFI